MLSKKQLKTLKTNERLIDTRYLSERTRNDLNLKNEYVSKNVLRKYFKKFNFLHKGNDKLSKKVLNFNLTSTTQCPSRALGLCNIAHKCYARKNEEFYGEKNISHHDKQGIYFDRLNDFEFMFIVSQKYHNAIIYNGVIPEFLRISVFGDIRSVYDVYRLDRLAKYCKELFNIVTYTYTHRKDLLEVLKSTECIVICGSGFMVHNNFLPIEAKSIAEYDCISYKKHVTKGDKHYCGDKCKKCMKKAYKVITTQLE